MIYLIIFAVLVAVALWVIAASSGKADREEREAFLEWERRKDED